MIKKDITQLMEQKDQERKNDQIRKSLDIPVDGDMSTQRCKFLLLRIRSEEEKLEWKGFGLPKTNQEKAAFAKAVIGMANTKGGWILLGKEKTGNLGGISENFLEITELSNVVNSFVQPEIKNLKVATFNDFEEKKLKNKSFAMVFVPRSILLPHITIRDGDSIKKNTLYVRHSGQSEPASYSDSQRIIRECVILRQSELLEYLEKSQISKELKEMKDMLKELSGRKKKIKKKKEVVEEEQIKNLFLKDEDFVSEIKDIMEEENG